MQNRRRSVSRSTQYFSSFLQLFRLFHGFLNYYLHVLSTPLNRQQIDENRIKIPVAHKVLYANALQFEFPTSEYILFENSHTLFKCNSYPTKNSPKMYQFYSKKFDAPFIFRNSFTLWAFVPFCGKKSENK